MSRFVFKSLEDSNRRYVVSSERLTEEYRNTNQFLGDRLGWFDTMGDGETQHCPMGRIPIDMFEDFCASATDYLLSAGQAGDDMARLLSSEIRHYGISASAVRGAAAVVWKDGKRRYFNRREDFKISGAESKAFDKRWDEIVQWMDGSFSAVVGLLKLGSDGFLRNFNAILDCSDLYETVTGNNSVDVWQVLEWLHWSWRDGLRRKSAFQSLRSICRAVESRDNAARVYEAYRFNIENDKRLAAEDAAKVA